MPLYKYRAATKTGEIVEYKADAPNKYALLKKLKSNDLYPISVISLSLRADKKGKKQKRNIETSNSVLKQVRAEQIQKDMNRKENVFKNMTQKIKKIRQ